MIPSSACPPWPSDQPGPAGERGDYDAELHHAQGRDRFLLELLRESLRHGGSPSLSADLHFSGANQPRDPAGRGRSRAGEGRSGSKGRAGARTPQEPPSLPDHLPQVEVVVEPASTTCSCCSDVMHRIGEDVSGRLDIVPPQYQVLVIRRPTPPRRGAGSLHPGGAADRGRRRAPGARARPFAGTAQGQRQALRRRDPGACAGPGAPAPRSISYGHTPTTTGPGAAPEPPGVAFVYSGDRATSSPALHLAGYRGVLQVDGNGA